ncbi:MAG: Gfo/Idh/MocA family oxidoreductase [Chloroflexota bacterium]
MMRFGIVSFAHLHATSYARCLQGMPEARLVAIADDDANRGPATAVRLGVPWLQDYHDLLACPDVDAVIVTTPNAQHAEVTIAAARAGKHVLCEKPLATTLIDGQAMIAACQEAGVALGTAFPCRYIPAVVRVKEQVNQGRAGKLLAISGTNHGTMPPGWFLDESLSGGGAVIDHTVHVADLIRWITGAEFAEVYAEVDTLLHDVSVEDVGLLSFKLTDGTICTLDCSWSRLPHFPTWGDVTLSIVGDAGVVNVDAFNQKINLYTEEPCTYWVHWGSDMDYLMIQDFAHHVSRGGPPPITGEDGLRALELALGAYRSAREKRPVYLPLR